MTQNQTRISEPGPLSAGMPLDLNAAPPKLTTRTVQWISIAVAVVITLVLGGMLSLQNLAQEDVANRDRAAQMKLISGALTSAFDQAGKFALSLAEATARRADIGEALSANDRARLQALSQGVYDYLHLQAGVQIFGYHSKDIRYLLRMHKVESSGDDISGFRPMVVAANRTRRAQTGVEIGIAGIGIRGVTVVDHNKEFAGTMEAGLDIRPILDIVKTSTNADIAVIIAPTIGGVALDPKLASFGDLTLALSTDDDLFAALLKSNRIRPTRDIQIGTQIVNGRSYGSVAQPLVDFSGKLVGMTIALKENPQADSRRVRTELWVAALCGGILAYIAFSVLLQAGLARRRSAA